MAVLERTITKAGRRAAANLVIAGAGRGLVIGAVLGLGVLALDRAALVAAPAAAFAVLPLACAVAGAVLALRRRPSAIETAVRLDRFLRLKDTLGTAEALRAPRRPRRGDDLAPLVQRDAERLAGRIDARAATPIRVTGSWLAAAALVPALAAGFLLLPRAEPARGAGPRPDPEALRHQQARLIETIDEAAAGLDENGQDNAVRGELETLERLAEQLGGEPESEDGLAEARDRSAADLDGMADRLAEEAQRNLDAVEEVTRRATELADAERDGALAAEPPEAAEPFLDALQRGDPGEAAERFEQLMEQAGELPPDQRQALADALRDLGEKMADPPADARAVQQQREALREALDDLGVDEQAADELLDGEPPAPPEEPLQEQELDPETARRIGEEIENLRRREQVSEQAQKQQRRLGEALRKAAEDVEAPARQEQQQPDPRAEQPPGEPQRRDGRQPEPRDAGEQGGERPETTPGRQRQQREEAPQQTQQQRQEQRRGEGEPPGGRQEQRRGGATPEQQAQREAAREAPGAQRTPAGEAPGETPGARPEPSQRPAGETPSVSEALRELQRMRREAQKKQQASERLRETARRLADTMTEQERRRLLEQWMSQDGAPGGDELGGAGVDNAADGTAGPFRELDDVDLRGEQEPDQVIAEWLGDAEPGDRPAARTTGRTRARQARSAAEQAVEKTVVPSRYHELIRRYFGRLEETVERAAPQEDPDAKR